MKNNKSKEEQNISNTEEEVVIEKTQEMKPVDVKELKKYVGDSLNVATDETIEINVIKREFLNSKKGKQIAKAGTKKKIKRFSPTIEQGLTTTQVDDRIADKLNNTVQKKYSKTYFEIFCKNIFTFFNLLLTIIAVALIVVGSYSDLFFVVIVVLNTGIGIFQEIKAKQTIDKLTLVTAPTVDVVRNGTKAEIPVSNLVLDDIMFLKTGKQISSDSIVVKGVIEVNESLLTGESLPIKKKEGDLLLSGSFVVSGTCFARVEKVGDDNYVTSLQEKAKEYKKTQSKLLKSMNLIITIIACIIVPLGVGMFFNNYITSPIDQNPWVFAVKRTAGSLVGMIPSGMFLLTSVALAVGVIRLAKRRTSVQELYCIEMLARVNTLCLDKTGTLTDGSMEVEETKIFDHTFNIPEIVGSYLNCFEETNQTSIALIDKYSLNTIYKEKNKIPFSSSRKYSAVTFDNGQTFVLGAPEYIYKGKNQEVLNSIKQCEEQGLRTLMLGFSKKEIVEDKFVGTITPIALFIFSDNIRKDARETIKWFNDNDVEIRIISGDNPLTVSQIANKCGVKNYDQYVSLAGLGLEEVRGLALKYTIFGRSSPEQKAVIIETLHNSNRTVAMTGDGVNDILALKQSDCSIAMANGSEAARNVSHLVLLDSNFSSMPKVVEEGRRVINNIQRTSALFLTKTIFTMLLSLATMIISLCGFSASYLFTPKNFMIWEICSIGMPAFFLALEPNKNRIKGNFIKNVIFNALPGALSFILMIALLVVLRTVPSFGINTENMAQISVVAISFMGLVVLYDLCKPLNVYRIVLFIIMFILSIIGIFFIPPFFTGVNFRNLEPVHWLIIILIIFLTDPLYRTLHFVTSKINKEEVKK